MDFWERNGAEYCDWYYDADVPAHYHLCAPQQEAHDPLMWEVKPEATLAYKRRLAKMRDSDRQPRSREERILPEGLALHLRAGDDPGLVPVREENRVTVEPAGIRGLVAALANAVADLTKVRANCGVHHA